MRVSISVCVWVCLCVYERCTRFNFVITVYRNWRFNLVIAITRSSRLEVFYKKGVLENFAKFTRKHLHQSLSFNNVASPRLMFNPSWKNYTHNLKKQGFHSGLNALVHWMNAITFKELPSSSVFGLPEWRCSLTKLLHFLAFYHKGK